MSGEGNEEAPLAGSSASSSKRRKPKATKTAEDYLKGGKVVIMFQHVGDAPPLKQKKFMLAASLSFHHVLEFLKKQLQSESLV